MTSSGFLRRRYIQLFLLSGVAIGLTFVFAHRSSGKDVPPKVHPFLPEIISQFPNVRDAAVSPAGTEVYFSAQSYMGDLSAIVFVTKTGETFSKPEVAPFSGKYHDIEPFFSQNGLRLYFASDRPLANTADTVKDYDIWYVERKTLTDQWSAPVNMGGPVNTRDNEFYPSVTLSGNLYLTCDGEGSTGKDDIFICRYTNGKYQPRVPLSDSINSAGYEFNAFVAPDESFIIYTCYNREGGYGSGDLYISQKGEKGEWTKAENMGPAINSAQMDYCPFVDTRTSMLYFTSKRNKTNQKFDRNQTLDELLKEMNRYDNGLSRLYQVNIKSGWR